MGAEQPGTDRGLDQAASDFLELRPRLFGIAYRMLGSVAEAEDILQEVWLRWQKTDRTVVIFDDIHINLHFRDHVRQTGRAWSIFASDGKYVGLSGSTQTMAERVLGAIGRPELVDDPRFRTNSDRLKNVEALDSIVAEFFAQLTQAEAVDLMEKAEVTVGPIYDASQILQDRHVIEREILADAQGLPSVFYFSACLALLATLVMILTPEAPKAAPVVFPRH